MQIRFCSPGLTAKDLPSAGEEMDNHTLAGCVSGGETHAWQHIQMPCLASAVAAFAVLLPGCLPACGYGNGFVEEPQKQGLT